MARQILPIAGAIVGGIIGGPFGAQVGFALGSVVGGIVDPEVIQGPKIGEAGLQTSAEGVYRPVVFAKGAIKGNVIARGNRQVKTERSGGGKGGPVTEQDRVYWTFAIRLCEGPITGIMRIWQDEKLVYDVRPESVIPEETIEFAERFTLYLGDETQLPDPDLEAFQDIGNTPAYRGTAYVVFPNYDLTDRRESIPDFRFEVATLAETGYEPALLSSDLVFAGPPDDLQEVGEVSGWNGPLNRSGSIDRNGLFLAGGYSADPFLELAMWDGSQYVAIPTPDNAPIGRVHSTAFSPVANMLVVSARYTGSIGLYPIHRLYLYSYDQTGEFTLRSTFDGTGGEDGQVTWSPDGSRVAWATPLDPITNGGVILGITDTGVFGAPNYRDAYPVAQSPRRYNWSPGGVYLMEENNLSIRVWRANSNPFDLVAESGDGNASAGGIWFGSTIIAVSESEINSFVLSGDELVGPSFITNPPGTLIFDASGTMDGNYLAIATNDSTTPIYIYERNGLSLDPISNQPATTLDTALAVMWSPLLPGSVIGTPTTLGDIVSTLHDRVGQESSKYSVAELIDPVEGFVIAGEYTAADAIRTLMPVYFFDSAEYDSGSGYRIHYVKRGKPVVLTVTDEDLLEAPERSTREDALERPRVLHLHYENPTIGYAPAKATSRRDSPDVLVVGEISKQVPVCFSDVDEPARISSKLMKVAWVEVGGEEEFAAHDGLLELVPSDCIGVSLRGQTRRMRIVQDHISPGELRWRLIQDRQSAYTSNVTGVPVPEPTPPLPSIVGDTVFAFADLPALNDNDDRLIWYEAATGQTEAWYGAQTQRKINPMVEFENSVTFNDNTIMGVLMNSVPSASEHYTDTTNSVTVQLYTDDVLDSLTEAQFLSEGGAFALRTDGGWEILQYRDAEEVGDMTFTLTTLLRGRLNTGGQDHLPGSMFVLLDTVRSSQAQTAWINQEVTSRAISFGQSADGAAQYVNTYTAKSQTEFPVAYLFGDRVADTLSLSTIPRHRFGTETNPIRSINWTGYRWTATDGVNSASQDSTLDNVTFDVTGWSSPITATVSQLNRFTGAGPAVSEEIP